MKKLEIILAIIAVVFIVLKDILFIEDIFFNYLAVIPLLLLGLLYTPFNPLLFNLFCGIQLKNILNPAQISMMRIAGVALLGMIYSSTVINILFTFFPILINIHLLQGNLMLLVMLLPILIYLFFKKNDKKFYKQFLIRNAVLIGFIAYVIFNNIN